MERDLIANEPKWVAWDKEFVWHPYTQMKGSVHLNVESAKGSRIKLTDGRELIDAVSSWWVNPHGHSHPYIAEKLSEQAKNLAHVIFAGFRHEPAAILAEKIAGMLPGDLSKVFFSDNGSTAVEAALKMSIQYHYNQGKTKSTFIVFEGSYHGDTLGAISTSAPDTFFEAFKPFTFEVIRIPVPNAENRKEVFNAFHEAVKQPGVAGFIFEPLVQGAAGMRTYPPHVLDELIGMARKWGVICIADEVMTGFGRTGKNFAIEYLQHVPDIICLSKCLTGGSLPMALTVANPKMYQAFYDDDKGKMFFHGHSFTGNPLGCAVSIASMELLETRECQENIRRIGLAHKGFAEKIKHHPAVTQLRMFGTILAFDWKVDDQGYYAEIRDKLYNHFLDKGVLLRPLGNVVYILPPYCITTEELDQVYDSIETALDIYG